MYLIDENKRFSERLNVLFEYGPEFVDFQCGRIELIKGAVELLRDDTGEGGFADTRRTIEKAVLKGIFFYKIPQRRRRREEMLLSDNLIERTGAVEKGEVSHE